MYKQLFKTGHKVLIDLPLSLSSDGVHSTQSGNIWPPTRWKRPTRPGITSSGCMPCPQPLITNSAKLDSLVQLVNGSTQKGTVSYNQCIHFQYR